VTDSPNYRIVLEPLVTGLGLVDVNEVVDQNEPWFNQTLCPVNDCVVRVGILDGDFHWHKHDAEDEFFFVVSGHLIIDVEGKEPIDLRPGQGALMPRTVIHRPRAVEKTVVLMFEGAGVVPTGD